MTLNKVLPYAKAAVTVAGAVVTAVSTISTQGSTPTQITVTGLTALLTALAVYWTPYAPKVGKPDVITQQGKE